MLKVIHSEASIKAFSCEFIKQRRWTQTHETAGISMDKVYSGPTVEKGKHGRIEEIQQEQANAAGSGNYNSRITETQPMTR